jgi:hypothetical protein
MLSGPAVKDSGTSDSLRRTDAANADCAVRAKPRRARLPFRPAIDILMTVADLGPGEGELK